MFKVLTPVRAGTPSGLFAVGVLSVNIKSVFDVFLMRHQFKVFQSVVGAVKILVVNLKPPCNRAIKGFPYQPMNGATSVLSVSAQLLFNVNRSCA